MWQLPVYNSDALKVAALSLSLSLSLAIRMERGIKIAFSPLYKARFKAEGRGPA
jgi:hypothetical protein